MNRDELLNNYFYILTHHIDDTEVFICKDKNNHIYHFFLEKNNNFELVDEKLENKLREIFDNSSTGINYYVLMQEASSYKQQFSNSINKAIDNINNVTKNIGSYKKNIIQNNLNKLGIFFLNDYLKAFPSKNISSTFRAFYDESTNCCVFKKEDILNEEVVLHEMLHCVSYENEQCGFQKNINGVKAYSAVNEYFTEHIVKKCYPNHKINYFTFSIFNTLFMGQEDKFVNAYFNNNTNDLIYYLAEHYSTKTSKIESILCKADTLLDLYPYGILHNVNEINPIVTNLYQEIYNDLIKLQIHKLKKEDYEINNSNIYLNLEESKKNYPGFINMTMNIQNNLDELVEKANKPNLFKKLKNLFSHNEIYEN